MSRLRYNNQQGILGAILGSGGTTITFQVIPSFATLVAPDYIVLVLEPGTINEEIVYLTAYTSGQLTGTVVRNQEGSPSSLTHALATTWQHGPTSADFWTRNVIVQAANYTAKNGDVVLANATSGAIALTLPAVAANLQVIVKKTDNSANKVTVTPQSGTIDGAANFVIWGQYHSITFVSDGTNWFVTETRIMDGNGNVAAGSYTASVGPYGAFLPGNSAVATPSGISTGIVWDWGGELWHIKAAGCKVDAATNDTVNAQKAIDAAGLSTQGAGYVYVPAGTMQSDALKHRSNVRLGGAGTGVTTIKMITGALGDATIYNYTFVTFANGPLDPNWAPRETNIGLEELTVDGNKANVATRYGVIYRPCSHVRVRRVRVINTGLQGMMLQHSLHVELDDYESSGTIADGWMISDCVDFRVRNPVTEDSGDFGGEVGAGYDYGSPNSPAAVAAGSGVVTDAIARGCTNYGLGLRGFKNAGANPNNRLLQGVKASGTVDTCGNGVGIVELTANLDLDFDTRLNTNAGGVVTIGAGGPATGQRSRMTGTYNDNGTDGISTVTAQGMDFEGIEAMRNAHNGMAGSFLDCAVLASAIRNNSIGNAGVYDNLAIQATSTGVKVRGVDLLDRGARTARYDLNTNGQDVVALNNEIGTFSTSGGTTVSDISTPATGAGPALATSGSVNPRGFGTVRVTPAAAVTLVTLVSGTVDGEVFTLVNEGAAASTITFDVAGTSLVADGASSPIPGLTARKFVWNAYFVRWFRTT